LIAHQTAIFQPVIQRPNVTIRPAWAHCGVHGLFPLFIFVRWQ